MSDNQPSDGGPWKQVFSLQKKELISDLRERSKNDREIIVGSEIRQLCKIADEYRVALEALYEEVANYIKINNLGDVHHNKSMQMARDAF